MQVLETCLYARDLEAARRFYEGVLGLVCFRFDPPRQAFFRAGNGVLLLFNPEETNKPGPLPPHGAWGSVHVCFRISEEELDSWRERLAQAGLEIEETSWPGGARSLYVRDPAGNLVELAPARIWGL